MPRFVILEHDWPTPHWDFLLEAGPVLRAWRLLAEPVPGTRSAGRAERRPPAALPRLRRAGVSGDRGRVARWDAGTFEWVADDAERVEVELCTARNCRVGVRLNAMRHGRLSGEVLHGPNGVTTTARGRSACRVSTAPRPRSSRRATSSVSTCDAGRGWSGKNRNSPTGLPLCRYHVTSMFDSRAVSPIASRIDCAPTRQPPGPQVAHLHRHQVRSRRPPATPAARSTRPCSRTRPRTGSRASAGRPRSRPAASGTPSAACPRMLPFAAHHLGEEAVQLLGGERVAPVALRADVVLQVLHAGEQPRRLLAGVVIGRRCGLRVEGRLALHHARRGR